MNKVQEYIKAQQEYCKENHMPNFVNNGVCYHCHSNVFNYEHLTIEWVRNHLVTHCPYCHHSFVE